MWFSVAHSPLQIPKDYYVKYDNDESHCADHSGYIYPGGPNSTTHPNAFKCRSIYQSMVNFIDEIIGNITIKLKQTGLWNNTLVIMASDNGGPINLQCCGGNNNPLRGGKETSWEGGIRSTALVSGGWNGLPNNRRGKVEYGMIHIADWYVTSSIIL